MKIETIVVTETIVMAAVIIGVIVFFGFIKAMTPRMLLKRHEKLQSAAEQGDFFAAQELAYDYMDSKKKHLFEQYPNLAVDVFKAANKMTEMLEAKLGANDVGVEPYYILGLMYEEGFGTQRDISKAVEYFNKALEFINSQSKEDAEMFKKDAEKIKQKLQQYS